MPKMYRVMYAEGGLPVIGVDDNMLGVRPKDIPVVDGNVATLTGGLSTHRCLCATPPLIVPRALSTQRIIRRGAIGPDDGREGWMHGSGPFVTSSVNDKLNLNVGKKKTHGSVEPVKTVTIEEYQTSLANTRNEWSIVRKPNHECPKCKQLIVP